MARPTDPNLRNPFTEGSTSPALTHANENAAFLRDVRPGNNGDTGGSDLPGNVETHGGFGVSGLDHPWQDTHPDQTAMPSLPTQAKARGPRFTIPAP